MKNRIAVMIDWFDWINQKNHLHRRMWVMKNCVVEKASVDGICIGLKDGATPFLNRKKTLPWSDSHHIVSQSIVRRVVLPTINCFGTDTEVSFDMLEVERMLVLSGEADGYEILDCDGDRVLIDFDSLAVNVPLEIADFLGIPRHRILLAFDRQCERSIDEECDDEYDFGLGDPFAVDSE